jgi:hypothetical protein
MDDEQQPECTGRRNRDANKRLENIRAVSQKLNQDLLDFEETQKQEREAFEERQKQEREVFYLRGAEELKRFREKQSAELDEAFFNDRVPVDCSLPSHEEEIDPASSRVATILPTLVSSKKQKHTSSPREETDSKPEYVGVLRVEAEKGNMYTIRTIYLIMNFDTGEEIECKELFTVPENRVKANALLNSFSIPHHVPKTPRWPSRQVIGYRVLSELGRQGYLSKKARFPFDGVLTVVQNLQDLFNKTGRSLGICSPTQQAFVPVDENTVCLRTGEALRAGMIPPNSLETRQYKVLHRLINDLKGICNKDLHFDVLGEGTEFLGGLSLKPDHTMITREDKENKNIYTIAGWIEQKRTQNGAKNFDKFKEVRMCVYVCFCTILFPVYI